MHPPPSRHLRAAVFHPLPLITAGVIHTLTRDGDIDVVPWAFAQQGQDADVVIADQETALSLAAEFSRTPPLRPGVRPRSRLVVIAAASREPDVRAALQAGVQGYLLARCSPDELLLCVKMIHAGSRYLSEGAMKCIADSLAHEKLTPREVTVLALLADGLANKAIANRLSIGLGTVKSHVVAILDKLGVGNRTQAVTVAASRGLIKPRGEDATLMTAPWWQAMTQPHASRLALEHDSEPLQTN